MKQNIKKALIATAVSASCLGNVAMAGEVTVWAWDPNFNIAIMNTAAEFYNVDNPDTKINAIDYAKESVEQKLHTMLTSGVTSALPEIALIDDYNAQKYLQTYPGAFEPLTNKFNYNDFAPYKVSVMTLDNEVYGVPFDSGVGGLFYRSDILEEAGFKAEDLENITWKRFIEIGKIVKEKTDTAMLAYEPSYPHYFRLMIQSAGAWYYNKDGSLHIKNNKAVHKAVEIHKAMVDAGITRPAVGWNELMNAIGNSNVATHISGAWMTASILANKDQSGNWAIAPIPRMSIEGSINSSNVGGSSWYVLKDSKNKAEAIDFLKETFGSNNEFYGKILKERGAVATYLPSFETEAYAYKDKFFSSQAVYKDFSKWIEQVPAVSYGIHTYEIEAAIWAQMPAILDGKSITDALEGIETQLKYSIQ